MERTIQGVHSVYSQKLNEQRKLQAFCRRGSRRGRSAITDKDRIIHENWTGEETTQDAVLRMLIDKYKPLRSGSIQSAEKRLKQNPPRLWTSDQISAVPSIGSWSSQPLLPSTVDHQPWHTQFKAPSHATSSIKHVNIPPVSIRKPSTISQDDRARRKEKAEKKKEERIEWLAQARESALDYRLGVRRVDMRRANPMTLKGWAGLVEDKIQAAHSRGLFKTVKGRGQPIVRHVDESNPFIAREEFLMNRIVQRNGAFPPWVEIQGDLDTAIHSFRDILRKSWIRHTVRTLTPNNPTALLHASTQRDIKAFRDPNWEQREHSYHEAALKEVNSLVRKYNGAAPYIVRRPFYVKNAEMDRLYETCAEEIWRELAERAQETVMTRGNIGAGGAEEVWSFGDHLRKWKSSFPRFGRDNIVLAGRINLSYHVSRQCTYLGCARMLIHAFDNHMFPLAGGLHEAS